MKTINKKLEVARSLAFELCRTAIWDEDRCNWLGQQMEYNNYGQKTHYVKPLGNDLYEGLPGIAIFLAACYKTQADELIAQTLEGCLQNILALETQDESKLSFFTGIIGQAYAFHHAALTLNRDDWRETAKTLLKKAKNLSPVQWSIDVIDGNAGVIPILLHLDQHYPELTLQILASQLGDDLIAKAEASEQGLSWKTIEGMENGHLLGFGHGTAGIAQALLLLHAQTEQDKYLDAGLKALDYENHFYSEANKNWPDLRFSSADGQLSYPCFWCHGASGIGFSRIVAYKLTGKETYLQDLRHAASTVLDNLDFLKMGNFSLCHGLFGNTAFLQLANEVLNDDTITQAIEAITSVAVEQFYDRGRAFPADAPGKNLSPGLMLGSAGIGYHLLEQALPGQFPSILGLQNLDSTSVEVVSKKGILVEA
jgi:type 2 lantibiotic biosynthesis protein LanM